MYSADDSVYRKMRQAMTWCFRAMNAGHPGAMFNLARMYENGNGVDKDRDLTLRWYQKAAEAGHKNARVRLGRR
jgi:TPR repeat protein